MQAQNTYVPSSILVVKFEVYVLGHHIKRTEVNAEEVSSVETMPYNRNEERCVYPENVLCQNYSYRQL